METYNGHVRTPIDATILFEACRIGLLPRVQRRLSEKERQSIKSGSVFVWDEREAGMRRWTDGKSWSASRVSGSFLTYREMEGKRGGNSFDKNASRDSNAGANDPDSDGGPDGYRYKPDGLIKQSFSITTTNNQHLHLISYFSRSPTATQALPTPSGDPQLRHIRIEKGLYPETTLQEQSTIPAVTRGPMQSPGGAPYTHSPNESSTYSRPPPQYAYGPWAPPSPMHTPPQHHQHAPYFPQQGPAPYHHAHGPPPPPAHHAQYPHPYPPPPPGSTIYDRPPPPASPTGVPPPPHHHYGAPPPHHYSTGYPPPAHSYPYHPPPASAPPYGAPPRQHYAPPSRPSTMDGPQYGSDERAMHDKRHDSHYYDTSRHQGPPHLQPPPPLPALRDPRQNHPAPAVQPRDAPTNESGAAHLPPPPPPPPSGPQTSTAQTIPSISAMLNGGSSQHSNSAGGPGPSAHSSSSAAAAAPPSLPLGRPAPPHAGGYERPHSRSPPGGLRTLQDIPSHKLGFEANRDVQALRNLDRSTFKY